MTRGTITVVANDFDVDVYEDDFITSETGVPEAGHGELLLASTSGAVRLYASGHWRSAQFIPADIEEDE